MSNKRGQLNCSKKRKNTGFNASCFEDWKLIKGAFIYDTPRSYTDEELSDLRTLLENEAANDDKSLRMFPVHKFVAPTDNTEDVVIQTFDYGAKIPVRDGDNDWMFQFVDGGNCLNASLRSHNGPAHVLFYDKDYKILGTNINNKMSTIPLQFLYTKPWGLPTGSTTAAYLVRFVFESKYVNEQREFIKADFDLSEIKGLEDVKMVLNSFDQNTGIANVTFQTECGAVNLYDKYNADITADLLSASDDEGNEVAINTLTPVAGNKTFDIAMDTGDLPDSGIVTLSGPAPSVLEGVNIIGYEIEDLELTIEGS